MKAVILVGGQGTRLRPLTANTPKAMVPVLNKPFLEYVIGHLARHNIRDIVLAQGHLAQPIEDHFGNGRRTGVNLSYTSEESPLGTAGAVKNAQRYLDGSFLVQNGDVFTDLDITAMLKFHREKKARVTIALTPVEDPTSYGLVETNPAGRVIHFLEKPSWKQVTTNMINAGTYIVEADVLTQVPEQTKFSFEHQLFPSLLEQGEPVYAYPSPSYWIDIGSPAKYFLLNKDLLYGKSVYYSPSQDREVITGQNCRLHPTAKIEGPAVIGSNCTIGGKVTIKGPGVIGADCHLHNGAIIEEAITWRGVHIGVDARVKGSIIANHCHLGAGSVIEDSVLGDNVTVADGCRLEPGSQINSGTTISQSHI